MEVDEKMWKKEEEKNGRGDGGGMNVRGLSRQERKERIRRNERKMRANAKRAGKPAK